VEPESERLPGPSPAFLLMGLGAAVRTEVEDGLRAVGMTLPHLAALGHLAGEPGLSYSELARRAGVAAQSMQATLQQLERLGAVVRTTAPGRGRTARLEVTEHGRELLDRGRGVMTDADDRVLADVPTGLHRSLTEALLAAFVAGQRRRSTAEPRRAGR
jgi:DNA-binding MarR family transcriptional regulator